MEVYTLKILGNEYKIKSHQPWEEIQRLSSHLELKMEEIRKASPSLSSGEISLLAALSVLEEVEEKKKREEELLKSKLRLLIEKMESV